MNMVDASKFREIGRSVLRKEDFRLLTGKGRFADDFNMPAQAWTIMVRSPHPHARIVRIDTAQARAMPGVLAVFTGRRLSRGRASPVCAQCGAVNQVRHEADRPRAARQYSSAAICCCRPTRPAMFGEAVAMVVAESREQAEDAADAVQGRLRTLPGSSAPRTRVAPGAPAVWDETPDNVLVDTFFGDRDGTDRAFAAADHVIGRGISCRPHHAVTASSRAPGLPIMTRKAAATRFSSRPAAPGSCGRSGNLRRAQYRSGSIAARRLRYRRQFRHQKPPLCGTRSRALGLAQARQADQISSDAPRIDADRISGTRSVDQGRAGVARGRPVPGDASRKRHECRRALRLAVPTRQGRGPHHRVLRHSGRDAACARNLHQHGAQ